MSNLWATNKLRSSGDGASASIQDTVRAPCITTGGYDYVKSLRFRVHGTCAKKGGEVHLVGVAEREDAAQRTRAPSGFEFRV